MLAIAVISAILTFTLTALANPAEKRDTGNLRLYEHHCYRTQCGPGAAGGGNTPNSLSNRVHDDCNGGGCNAEPAENLTPGESFCDQETKSAVAPCGS